VSASDYVVLRNGPTVPRPALELAWRLEDRGCSLSIDGDSLVVTPRQLLSETDREAIRRWRWHLIALVATGSSTVQ